MAFCRRTSRFPSCLRPTGSESAHSPSTMWSRTMTRSCAQTSGCSSAACTSPLQQARLDATAALWVRTSEVAGDLDEVLYATMRRWLADRWPFTRIAWPGRELPWKHYDALPDP